MNHNNSNGSYSLSISYQTAWNQWSNLWETLPWSSSPHKMAAQPGCLVPSNGKPSTQTVCTLYSGIVWKAKAQACKLWNDYQPKCSLFWCLGVFFIPIDAPVVPVGRVQHFSAKAHLLKARKLCYALVLTACCVPFGDNVFYFAAADALALALHHFTVPTLTPVIETTELISYISTWLWCRCIHFTNYKWV